MNYKLVTNPQTLGEKLRNKRLELGLVQKDVAQIFGLSEDGYRFWEIGTSNPLVRYYPGIIKFLGYFPFDVDRSTFGGKCIYIRYVKGIIPKELGRIMGVHPTTIHAWENGEHVPTKKMIDRVNQIYTSI